MADPNVTDAGDVGGGGGGAAAAAAGLLEYRAPERPPEWLLHVAGGQVTLSVAGAPAWWQLTTATAGLTTCGTIGAAAAWVVISSLGRPGGDEFVWFPLTAAACFGLLAYRAGRRMHRVLRRGPDRLTYHLGSRPLADATRAGALRYDRDVLHVDDVAAAPGRLLYTGQRELVLRLFLSNRSLFHVPWRGSRADVEQLADDLRAALRLDA